MPERFFIFNRAPAHIRFLYLRNKGSEIDFASLIFIASKESRAETVPPLSSQAAFATSRQRKCRLQISLRLDNTKPDVQ